jgi:hypothetical protein
MTYESDMETLAEWLHGFVMLDEDKQAKLWISEPESEKDWWKGKAHALLLFLDSKGVRVLDEDQTYLPPGFHNGDMLDRTADLIRRIDKEDGFARVKRLPGVEG